MLRFHGVFRSFLPNVPRLFLALALACVAGCRREELQTVYGQRVGPARRAASTARRSSPRCSHGAGHRVSSWDSLSPRLDRADCVVWFPDDFQPPAPDVVAWFDRWLQARPGRTLIYVGRDSMPPPGIGGRSCPRRRPTGSRRSQFPSGHGTGFQESRRSDWPSARCRWFSVRYDTPAGPARNISGDLEWLQNLDPAHVEIELNGRIVPSRDMDPLLEADDGLVLGRLEVGRGQILVAANGLFLLNATLVNREHRKLAGKLVDAIAPPAATWSSWKAAALRSTNRLVPAAGCPPTPSMGKRTTAPRGRGIRLPTTSHSSATRIRRPRSTQRLGVALGLADELDPPALRLDRHSSLLFLWKPADLRSAAA